MFTSSSSAKLPLAGVKKANCSFIIVAYLREVTRGEGETWRKGEEGEEGRERGKRREGVLRN